MTTTIVVPFSAAMMAVKGGAQGRRVRCGSMYPNRIDGDERGVARRGRRRGLVRGSVVGSVHG